MEGFEPLCGIFVFYSIDPLRMEVIGYILAVLIGVSLGLIGGGGSILTVPLLVYLFHITPVVATSYSLFIVGCTSFIGTYTNIKNGNARLTLALPLGIISPITVFIVRHYLVPRIPEHITSIRGYDVTKQGLTMVLFALLMLVAAMSMLMGRKGRTTGGYSLKSFQDYLGLAFFGIIVGCITGFLGAGGGFLIIPALVLFLRLPMKEAVGTSLLIIAINSTIGFLGDWGHYFVDWKFILLITGLAALGILIGGRLSRNIPAEKLKKGFGWFVLVMGTYIIFKEVVL